MKVDNMKKVCAHYLATYLTTNTVWIYNLLKNLTRYQPVIISRRLMNTNIFPLDHIMSLANLHKVNYLYNFLIFKTKGYFPSFKKYCKINRVKLLHTHFGYDGVKLIGLKKQLNIPMICSFYGYDAYKDPNYPTYYQKLKILFEEADKIFALGPHMKKRLIELGCSSEKIQIQHLGINVDEIEFKQRTLTSENKFQFLTAASFVVKKGIDDTLKSLHLIRKEINFTLHLIGDGILRNNILTLIKNLNLQNKVILYGYQPYKTFLNKCYKVHAYLQASKTAENNDKEGTPMSLVDAMATGLPVVSTHHSDIPEIVINGKTGFLAQENDPEGFAKAILKLLNNNENYKQFSRASRQHIKQHFNAKIQSLQIEKIYDELKINYT
jgi:colanic acid/amylovoran biosynthesis glycosyltransferase